jgi:hypothetical protein
MGKITKNKKGRNSGRCLVFVKYRKLEFCFVLLQGFAVIEEKNNGRFRDRGTVV